MNYEIEKTVHVEKPVIKNELQTGRYNFNAMYKIARFVFDQSKIRKLWLLI